MGIDFIGMNKFEWAGDLAGKGFWFDWLGWAWYGFVWLGVALYDLVWIDYDFGLAVTVD